MTQINREGTFNALPVKFGVGLIGNNDLPAVEIEFSICSERGADGVESDVSAERLTITKAFFLMKKDGAVNEHIVKSLREAFDWDGRDALWFEEEAAGLVAHYVQLVIGWGEINGRNVLEVKYLNAYGARGRGIRTSDEATKQAIRTRLNPKLRAVAGGTPRTPKPTTQPATGPGEAAMPPLPQPQGAATQDEAWRAYSAACEVGESAKDMNKRWFEIVQLITGQGDVSVVTPEAWYKVKADAPGMAKRPVQADQAQGLRDAVAKMPDESDKLVNAETGMPMHDRPATDGDIEVTKRTLDQAIRRAGLTPSEESRNKLAADIANGLGFDAQNLTSGQSGQLRRQLSLVSDNPQSIVKLLGEEPTK